MNNDHAFGFVVFKQRLSSCHCVFVQGQHNAFETLSGTDNVLPVETPVITSLLPQVFPK